jgi:hypothetical protein
MRFLTHYSEAIYRSVEIENTLNYAWSRRYQKFCLCIDGYKLNKTAWRYKRSNKNDRHVTIRWPNKKAKTLISECRDDTGCDMKKNIYYTGFSRNASWELTLLSTFILLSPVRCICPRGCNTHPSRLPLPPVVSVFGTYMVY